MDITLSRSATGPYRVRTWEAAVASPKKKRVGELDERRRARLKASDEGLELIERMHIDLVEISKFLVEEQPAIARRGLSTKRLARLRLISEDLGSAARFSSKSVKG